MTVGNMRPLGLFAASGCSVCGIELRSDTGAWIMGTLATPDTKLVAIVRSFVTIRDFSSFRQLCPVRIEHGGDTAAWIMGTLAVLRVQGNQLTQLQEAMTLLESFPSFWHLAIRRGASLAGPSLLLGPFSRLQGPTLGVIVCCLSHQGHKDPHPGWGPSVLLCTSGPYRATLPGLFPAVWCWCIQTERLQRSLLLSVWLSSITLPQVSWLSFRSIFHCNLLHQVPSQHLPSVY